MDTLALNLDVVVMVRLLVWETGRRDIGAQLDAGQITYEEAYELLRGPMYVPCPAL